MKYLIITLFIISLVSCRGNDAIYTSGGQNGCPCYSEGRLGTENNIDRLERGIFHRLGGFDSIIPIPAYAVQSSNVRGRNNSRNYNNYLTQFEELYEEANFCESTTLKFTAFKTKDFINLVRDMIVDNHFDVIISNTDLVSTYSISGNIITTSSINTANNTTYSTTVDLGGAYSTRLRFPNVNDCMNENYKFLIQFPITVIVNNIPRAEVGIIEVKPFVEDNDDDNYQLEIKESVTLTPAQFRKRIMKNVTFSIAHCIEFGTANSYY